MGALYSRALGLAGSERERPVSSVYYSKFVQLIAACVTEKLHINYDDRGVVEGLLTTGIRDELTNRGGLLDQFLHSQLDFLAETLKKKFDLDPEVRVNYENGAHAKFNNIIDALDAQMRKEKKPVKIPAKKSKTQEGKQ